MSLLLITWSLCLDTNSKLKVSKYYNVCKTRLCP